MKIIDLLIVNIIVFLDCFGNDQDTIPFQIIDSTIVCRDSINNKAQSEKAVSKYLNCLGQDTIPIQAKDSAIGCCESKPNKTQSKKAVSEYFNCLRQDQDTIPFQVIDSTIVCDDRKDNETQSEKTSSNWGLIFQCIAALGSLSTFGAFLILLFKDKNKQEQIDKLSNIAVVLEAQNEIMSIQNNLVTQQVEILRNVSIGNKNDAVIKELRDIEEKKLRLSVKPNLWLNLTGYNRGELKIDLNNKGEEAKLLEFNIISEDIELHSKSLPYHLEKGKSRYIYGKSKGSECRKDCKYEIAVVYADRLNNKYETIINGTGANAKITETREM